MAAAVGIPAIQQAHMDLVQPGGLGVQYISRVVSESLRQGKDLLKAQAGPQVAMAWALHELQTEARSAPRHPGLTAAGQSGPAESGPRGGHTQRAYGQLLRLKFQGPSPVDHFS